MLTGMTCLEWSCDVKQAHVWSFVIFPICGGIVRGKAYFCPRIFNAVIMSLVVKGELFEVISIDVQRNGWCFVSRTKTGFSLLWYTRPACHMPILRRSSNGRESNCVQFFEEQEFLVGWLESSRLGRWCSVRKGGCPGA